MKFRKRKLNKEVTKEVTTLQPTVVKEIILQPSEMWVVILFVMLFFFFFLRWGLFVSMNDKMKEYDKVFAEEKAKALQEIKAVVTNHHRIIPEYR